MPNEIILSTEEAHALSVLYSRSDTEPEEMKIRCMTTPHSLVRLAQLGWVRQVTSKPTMYYRITPEGRQEAEKQPILSIMVDLERKGVSEITTMDILNQPQKRMAKVYSLLELLGEFEEKGWIYKHRDPFRNYRLTIVGESVLNGKSSTTLYLDGPNDRFTNSTWILIFVLGVNAFMLLPWELSILTIICALLIRWVGVGRYRYLKRRPFSPTPLNP